MTDLKMVEILTDCKKGKILAVEMQDMKMTEINLGWKMTNIE